MSVDTELQALAATKTILDEIDHISTNITKMSQTISLLATREPAKHDMSEEMQKAMTAASIINASASRTHAMLEQLLNELSRLPQEIDRMLTVFADNIATLVSQHTLPTTPSKSSTHRHSPYVYTI